jgi:hypothetical protein
LPWESGFVCVIWSSDLQNTLNSRMVEIRMHDLPIR